jgi:hypothetical protein
MVSITSTALDRLPTQMARHTRLYSSTIFRKFSLVPSIVWSNWKAVAHTCCVYSAFSGSFESSADREPFHWRGMGRRWVVRVLADQTAGSALGCLGSFLQNRHGSAKTLRAQKMPSANTLSTALSSSTSASNRLSRLFCSSSSLRRLASVAFVCVQGSGRPAARMQA